MDKECCICKETKGRLIRYTLDNNFYCKRHYSQLKKGGIKLRTKYDINLHKIISVDGCDVVEVVLEDRYMNEIGKTLIDIEDYIMFFKDKRLGCDQNGYAVLGKYYVQRIILDTEQLIDHINGDRLDNRRCNLRVADKSTNAINCGRRVNNKSGYTGVTWNKNAKSWRVYLNNEGKRIELGYFKNKKDAAERRILNEFKYFGDFRHPYNLNKYIDEYGIDSFIELKNKNNLEVDYE